jgi:uncharacterized protein
MTVKIIIQKIVPTLKREGVLKAALFGSYARGEAVKNSDIDVLVKLKKNKSLLDLADLKIKLEKKLHKSVDVITYNSIHPLLKKTILKDERIIYAKRPSAKCGI